MDEVEAALDDVNLHRFLDLVHEFRQEAQLLIVSHQKRTMEAADVLYGVTMQPGGSSKVVSERVTSPERGGVTALYAAAHGDSCSSPSSSSLVLAGTGLVVTRRRRDTTLEPPPLAAGGAARAASTRSPPSTRPSRPRPRRGGRPRRRPVGEKPRFRDRLGKARSALSGYMGAVLARDKIDRETWDDLEEALILADVGVAATTDILERLRATVEAEAITEPAALLEALKAQLKADLATGDRTLRFEPGAPNVWLFVGVNGVGKTTTVGKVGKQQADEGRTVVMAAGDTFRAAAAEQLETWAERAGADLVRGAEGGDPSSIIFDAVQRAGRQGRRPRAGRHRRSPPHQGQPDGGAPQGAARRRPRARARSPRCSSCSTPPPARTASSRRSSSPRPSTSPASCSPSSTARPRAASRWPSSPPSGIPIKLVGLGETADDLVDFDPDEFVDALFAQD